MVETKIKDQDSTGDSILKKRDAIWPLVLFYIHVNILGIYGIYILLTSASWATILFSEFVGLINSTYRILNINIYSYILKIAALLTLLGILGVTVGVHRLWAHRTFTASKPLKVFLMFCQTTAGQVRKPL